MVTLLQERQLGQVTLLAHLQEPHFYCHAENWIPQQGVNVAHSLLPWLLAVEKLQKQRIEVPENTSRDNIPYLASPNNNGPSAGLQSSPNSVFVHTFPRRANHLDPKIITAQDKRYSPAKPKYCPDTKPILSLQTAAPQYAGTVSRLQICNLRAQIQRKGWPCITILLGAGGMSSAQLPL
eukprot:1158011-Pelagomonas_calceolata.AAC.7